MEQEIELLVSLEDYKDRLKAQIYRPSENVFDMIEARVNVARLNTVSALHNVMIEHFLNTSEKIEQNEIQGKHSNDWVKNVYFCGMHVGTWEYHMKEKEEEEKLGFKR